MTPNSWAYLFGFARFTRHVLGKEPNVALFKSMFTVSSTNRGNFDQTYAHSSVDKQVKGKFIGPLSRVHDWKANFVIMQRQDA